MDMQRSAVGPVAGKGQVEGHRHADTAKDMCVRKDLAVEVGAEGAKLVDSLKEVADMGFWMLEVAGPGRSEQSGNYQDLLVVDQAVLVVKRRMGSDGRACACLAPRGRVAEGSPGMGRDERPASHSDAYHDPSGLLDHTSRDGT